jgi:hypothetical protein
LIYLTFFGLLGVDLPYGGADFEEKNPLKSISSRFFPHFSPPCSSPGPPLHFTGRDHRVDSPEQSQSPTIPFSSKKKSRAQPDLPYDGAGSYSNPLIYLTGQSAKQRF